MSVYGSKSGTVTATGADNALYLDCIGHASLGIDVRGTFTATLVPEATIDNSNWFTLTITPVAGGAGVTSITAAGAWTADIPAYARVRIRASAYTSGTPTIVLNTLPVSRTSGATNNILGTVGIDQTTPGTTNLVQFTHGKTIKSVTGTVNADTDIIAAVSSKRIKVISITLESVSTTSNTITMQSNASTALYTAHMLALSLSVDRHANSVPAPSFLFATAAGEKLTLDVSTAQNVTYNVTYFDDDAT